MLGAIGILATTTYFIQDGLSFVSILVPFEVGEPGGGTDPWQIALYYVFAGLLILALGLAGRAVRETARRRLRSLNLQFEP